jgi:hypothetical protein
MRAVNEMIFWGSFGLLIEVLFTASRQYIFSKKRNLVGHTSLWMFPIYALGLTYGFDIVQWAIPNDYVRYFIYPFCIWLVELVVGNIALSRGVRIWDYRYLPQRLHYRGIISYIHYPVWVVLGLLVEMIK